MTFISTHIKRILTPATLMIFVVILGSYALSPCKGEMLRPNTVPSDASYNKKMNVFSKTANGEMKEWFENGNLVSQAKTNEFGILDGKFDRFDYLTGTIVSFGEFQMGERKGKWVWNFSNGMPYMEINFQPGNRKRQLWIPVLEIGNETGAYIRYFKNGRVNEKGSYDGGNRVGDWVRYYPDTKPESKGSYQNDKKIGEWFYYYPNGSKEAFELYTTTGEFLKRITYYPNGSIWCVTEGVKLPVCNANNPK